MLRISCQRINARPSQRRSLLFKNCYADGDGLMFGIRKLGPPCLKFIARFYVPGHEPSITLELYAIKLGFHATRVCGAVDRVLPWARPFLHTQWIDSTPCFVNSAELPAMELPPSYPKDPADRIIGATALVEGLSLLTADREIRRSRAVQTIW